MPSTPADPLDAVVAGYLGVDLAPSFARAVGPNCVGPAESLPLAQLLRPGRLVEVGGLTISLGGAVANTGLALARFGKRVGLMGMVGQDDLGDLALGLLKRHDVTLSVGRSPAPTAYGIVLAPPGSDRVFLECPGCNATFRASDLDLALVARSRLFHFGYPPLMPSLLAKEGAELAALFSAVRGAGPVTSLDMTLPDPDGPGGQVNWRALLARVLPHVDVFVPSIEELLAMLAPAEYQALTGQAGDRDPVGVIPRALYPRLAEEALALGAAVVLVKAGHRGGYLRTAAVDRLAGLGLPEESWAGRELWLQPFAADPARTHNASGAGDAAVAGFLSALLGGETAERAGRYAMLAGRDNLYGPDALSGLRSWEEMSAFLDPAPPG